MRAVGFRLNNKPKVHLGNPVATSILGRLVVGSLVGLELLLIPDNAHGCQRFDVKNHKHSPRRLSSWQPDLSSAEVVQPDRHATRRSILLLLG